MNIDILKLNLKSLQLLSTLDRELTIHFQNPIPRFFPVNELHTSKSATYKLIITHNGHDML